MLGAFFIFSNTFLDIEQPVNSDLDGWLSTISKNNFYLVS